MELKKIKFMISKDPKLDDVSIYADWRLYQLALFNILQNAVKFNNYEGKIEIQIKVRQGIGRTHQTLETIVKDTGIGIKKDIIHTLFEPFGRLR
jgi:signal transduction histidine kinase